jgi:hypothetical protein
MSEGFWWAALAIAGLSAGAHLLSMLGTHWGDRSVSLKALLFSVLAHLSLVFCLFAVGPRLERLGRSSEPEQEELEPLSVREVISDSDQPVSVDENGNVPVWDRPNETPETPQERTDRPFDVPEVAETDRTIEPPPPIEQPIPPVVELPETPEVTPGRELPKPEELAAAPPKPLEIEEETAEARAEDRPPLARSDRTPLAEAGEDLPPERAAAPLATDRVADDFDPQTQLADLRPEEAPSELPAMTSNEDPLKIERPSSPLPAPPEELAGAGGDEKGTEGDAALSSRFSRRPSRSPDFAGAVPSIDRGESNLEAPLIPRPDIAMSSIDRLNPSGLPSISRPDAAPLNQRKTSVPETYQLRAIERRSEIARKNGGTEGSEQAVERSLKWLADHQDPAGFWDADAYGAGQVGVDEEGINRQFAGKSADAGITALALLAFLGAGHTQDEGPHTENVNRAIDWLIKNQREDGFLAVGAAHFEQMYCHGMATYALGEAYGMQSDAKNSRIRRPLEKAVLYIASQQGEDGGWRYVKGQPGDMSMFGWQLMALKSSDIAGVTMPAAARVKMVRFLKDRSLGESNGLAAYREGLKPTPAMTAEALFCKQMLGMTRANPASVEAVTYLLQNAPKRSELNYYYWYYGTLAMYQFGGTAWERWNEALRDLLIAEQIKTGPDAGSWAPKDAWGPYGGRVYSTAIATLSLEVYYRFLPLYRGSEDAAAGE